MGGVMQPIDLFFGLYILANIDDKTYKISNKKADLVQWSFCLQKLVRRWGGCFIQEKKILQFKNWMWVFSLARGQERKGAGKKYIRHFVNSPLAVENINENNPRQ